MIVVFQKKINGFDIDQQILLSRMAVFYLQEMKLRDSCINY